MTGYMYLLQPNCGVPALNTMSLQNLDVLSCVLVAHGVTSPVGVVCCVMGSWLLHSLYFGVYCMIPILSSWGCNSVGFTY